MKYSLDSEEKELLQAFEDGQLKRSKTHKQDIATAIKTAKNHLKKDRRINIRLSQYDLEQIKIKAVDEGLPYQTLIASVLHKYVSNS